MSINRDESALPVVASATVSTFALSKGIGGNGQLLERDSRLARTSQSFVPSGAYFGPTEDIKLFMQELDVSVDLRVELPDWVIGTVIEGCFNSGYQARVVHHSGFRDGHPMFDIKRVSPFKQRGLNVIPKWVAVMLRLRLAAEARQRLPFSDELWYVLK